ncbi:MAG TPA: FAD-dependent oxidoreductase [Steroidobacteraceae bacterium]|nr:FAD-dependent oxidoreductase [Steroidobacteraceae bacterium]
MAESTQSILQTRREQLFPTLGVAEIRRLQRFGQPRHYEIGSLVARAGEAGEGLLLVLAGEVAMQAHESHEPPIVVHQAGSLLGELAQLSGRPFLVDGIARTAVDALLIAPSSLRELLIQEADLGELIMRALILRRVGLLQLGVGPVIIGRPAHRDVLRLQGFLRRNGYPFQTLDPDADEQARTLLERFHLSPADLPTVLCVNGELLRNPTESQLARCIGMSRPLDASRLYDVAIVGAGPAGLAAAVYAASEGLDVLVLDCRAFGGQAGASARIENYLGFPTGISGMALMARAYNQAQKFGVEIAIPEQALELKEERTELGRHYTLQLASDQRVQARAIVIASGAEYRRLDVPHLADYEGAHVHYWASPLEGRLCSDQEVALVGAGNSAGQAAVYLASVARKVWMFVRGRKLEDSMSSYLCERIGAQLNVEVLLQTQVVAVQGSDGALQQLCWRREGDATQREQRVSHLFLMIGAAPNTDWLARSGVQLDGKGFVQTNAPGGADGHPLETNLPGVFAIGDVRSSSVKRVAASVGEGAQVVAALHEYFAASRAARRISAS